jgi:murein DD-endopeptidase MepM/ murein hydrolase activator NlpD
MHLQRLDEIVLGNEQPLIVGRKFPDKRAFSRRWMTATVLLGLAAAALLSGALIAALGRRPRYADLPHVAGPQFSFEMGAEDAREDRDTRETLTQRSGTAVRIEQLNDSGSVRPFTRVSARLAEIDSASPSGENVPVSENRADDPDSQPQLPSIILHGASRPGLPHNVNSYAGDEEQSNIARVIGQPLNVSIVPKSPMARDTSQQVIVARTGDTLSGILTALVVPPGDESALLTVFSSRYWFGQETLANGDIITILEETQNSNAQRPRILKITIEKVDGERTSVARTDAGQYKRVVQDQSETRLTETASESDLKISLDKTLRDSLYSLVQSNHLDEGVVAELMRLCDHDFDLDQPLGAEDAAEILYTPNELGQPELVFVSLTSQGNAKSYYRFKASDDGSSDFYDGEGRSVTKFLLRKPVIDGRLGDGFGWRVHPVLGDRRFHEGVDYAAPYGSPIAAAGAGVVEIIGSEWGYGKYIRIRHDLGYETAYAHVAGFPKGLKVGDRVRQGETIAYVGSTGLSTGPHLYYEVWINGHRVNPLRIKLASGRILQGNMLKQFQESAQQIDHLIDASASLETSR